MRRYGMNGSEPFTPSDIDAANRLFDWQLQPHEVEALSLMDSAMLFPPKVEEESGGN